MAYGAFTLTRTPLGLPTVVELASGTPARIIGNRSIGRVQAGARADLVLLDADGRVVDVLAQGTRP